MRRARRTFSNAAGGGEVDVDVAADDRGGP
jgi:hypothetical protein